MNQKSGEEQTKSRKERWTQTRFKIRKTLSKVSSPIFSLIDTVVNWARPHTRVIVRVAILIGLVSGIILWNWYTERRDQNQIQRMIDRSFSLSDSSRFATVSRWSRTLAYYGRADDARTVARSIQDPVWFSYTLRKDISALVILSSIQESETQAKTNQFITTTAHEAVSAALEIDDRKRRYGALKELVREFGKGKVDRAAARAAAERRGCTPR